MEEKQIVDKLWDYYELTPSTAVEKRGEIESVAAGNRRVGELKRKISALGTPNLGAIEEYARVNERYTYLAEQLQFPAYYGRNLDALYDLLTERGEPLEILFTHTEQMKEQMGSYGSTLGS